LAHSYLKNNFVQNFLPKPVDQPAAVRPTALRKEESVSKKRKMSAVATFLHSDDGDDEVVDVDDAEMNVPIVSLTSHGSEKLDAYLVLPQAHHVNKAGEECDILAWWKTHAHMFPSLSKMARAYLAMLASSAGVERLFTAVGRMHSSFRKNAKEESLEMQLVVYQNA
jgi:hypothetical protein